MDKITNCTISVLSVQPPSRVVVKMCRLEANCKRINCKFVHHPNDLSVITCKFWREGGCLKSPCPFLHGYHRKLHRSLDTSGSGEDSVEVSDETEVSVSDSSSSSLPDNLFDSSCSSQDEPDVEPVAEPKFELESEQDFPPL